MIPSENTLVQNHWGESLGFRVSAIGMQCQIHKCTLAFISLTLTHTHTNKKNLESPHNSNKYPKYWDLAAEA